MKATVIAPVIINGAQANPGDVVDIDANTFANLARKNKLTAKVETAFEAPVNRQAEPTRTRKEK